MKLYTRSGDDGTTGLFGGERVGKDHPRVEAYGSVDELNGYIGFAAVACDTADPFHNEVLEMLRTLQSRLFQIGADLATPSGSGQESKITRLGREQVEEAEGWIDTIDGGNTAMRSFVLPGGTELSARLHLARAVCRRAERRVINLARSAEIEIAVIHYLNRIGDLLFALARRVNKEAGVEDIPWRA